MEQSYGSLSPAALGLLMIALMAVFALPRRFVIIPVLASTVLMTIGQAVYIFGANFYFLRIVILAALVRCVLRGDCKGLSLNGVDKAFLTWAAFAIIIAFVPKFRDPREVLPPATFASTFINRGGFAVDALGTYFVARFLVRSTDDIALAVRGLILICITVACFMSLERASGHNLFSALGGVPETSALRNGKFRCQGPFTHAIHAGNFGATLVPLCLALWLSGRRQFALVGLGGATIVTVLANSSGALMAWVYGTSAFLLWPLRLRMQMIRRLLLALVVVLHLVMDAPVWWAISRVADFTGGGGYWRSKLIDEYVNHISDWWLIGTNYTASWSPTGIGLAVWPDHMDLTNQYVVEGVHGGVIQLILFIAVIVQCFKHVGRAIHSESVQATSGRYIIWGLGSSLVGYMAAFLSVSGSMQTEVLYFALLGFIAAAPLHVSDPVAAEDSESEGPYDELEAVT